MVSGADDVEIWDDAETGDGFDRLVGGAVFANTDGVVGEDESDGEMGESGEADGRAEVVGKDAEGGSGDSEESIVSDAIADGAHGVFANSEPDVAAGWGFGREVAFVFEVIFGGSEKVGGSGDHGGNGFCDVVDDVTAGSSGGIGIVFGEGWNLVGEVGGDDFCDIVFEFDSEIWVFG